MGNAWLLGGSGPTSPRREAGRGGGGGFRGSCCFCGLVLGGSVLAVGVSPISQIAHRSTDRLPVPHHTITKHTINQISHLGWL